MRALFFIFIVFQLVVGACTSKSYQSSASDTTVILAVKPLKVPVFVEKARSPLLHLELNVKDSTKELSGITIHFSKQSPHGNLSNLLVQYHGEKPGGDQNDVFGEVPVTGIKNLVTGRQKLKKGLNTFSLAIDVKGDIDISHKVLVDQMDCHFTDGAVLTKSFHEQPLSWNLGRVVRAAGQDQCDTYRIPGMITTNKGTLIAVYDNRYNNSKDLQEDIDVGMSRSTDAGQTWEPMKVIMDMGEWGGLSQQLNGIGDPCVLYDHHTHTIWVAGLWLHGSGPDKMAWWDSKPGMKPGETGQFVVTKSTDDGLTWSEPMNITKQIKDPAWQLLLQGPGRGITLEDGTLVFPAQFKADIGEKALDGGQYTCHSTLVYSKDQGKTWQIGTGAKSNTTEAQVAVLSDGSLMLNMRDDRNRKDKGDTNGRAVAITSDLGKTWERHQTSNSALQESNCMASLISTTVNVNGQKKNVLFFSNPNNKHQRTNMTIKASLDDGMTWPFALELNEAGGFGYSCLSRIDDETIGILYEGAKELYFQKVAVSEILKSQN